jgi:CHAT domain-containing protein
MKFLIVGECSKGSSDWDALEAIDEEVAAVQDLLPEDSTTIIQCQHRPYAPTSLAQVIDHLPRSNVLHLACHGHQIIDDPVESGFVLGDSALTLNKLVELDLPDAVFAYLSACDTGKCDETHPDQAIHLAAAMLFVGFQSVIASLGQVIPFSC